MNKQGKSRILGVVGRSVLGSVAAVVVACSSVSDEPKTEQPTTGEQEIIGGFGASGKKLNAVGSLGLYWVDPYGGAQYFDPFCSGALISETTVLSAKHCTDLFEQAFFFGYSVGFGVGPNALAPSRIVEVVAVSRAPGDSGGFVGYGHDVGAFHLIDAVENVTPLGIAVPSASQVGQNFVVMGYGIQDNIGRYGTRRTGGAELRALEGRVFEILLGSFERFRDWYFGELSNVALMSSAEKRTLLRQPDLPTGVDEEPGEGGSDAGSGGTGGSGTAGTGGTAGKSNPGGAGGEGGGPGPDDYLREIYESTVLDEGYEVVVGGTPGDAQPCFGDSGGPLLKANGSGVLEIYGVASGGLSSRQMYCDFGAVYATFGPGVREFVEEAKNWVDPCEGLSVSGVCEGTAARRCSSRVEGPRRLVEFDCALIGETCEVQTDGNVGCGTEGEPIPVPAD